MLYLNKYELTLVVNPNLDDETCKAEVEKIKQEIARFKGSVETVDEWGKRRLAYEINYLTEGYYFIIGFDGEPETPKELESRLRINESVLRYLIVRAGE